MPEIILETRRAEARRAMEGEVWRKKREAEAQVLRRRREEAQLAMESNERRSKRQTAAAAARAQTEARATAKSAEDEKQQAARQAAEAAVEAERQRATQAAATAAGRQRQAQITSQTIDRLKAGPVEMSSVRTLKTDLAQAAAGGATLTQAIIREQGRKTAPGSSANANVPKSYHGWLAILVPILLLLGGAALVYIYYWPTTTIAPPPPEAIADPDEKLFLLTDERTEIENLNRSRETIMFKLRQTLNDGAVNIGRVTRLIPTEAARALALKPWLERLSISLPEKLIQPLEPKFLLGRYDNSDSPTAFLMLKTRSYEASFSGLRQNEKSLIDLFYRLTGRPALAPATTTPIFADQLSHNLETRRIKQDDKTILLYAFLDQSTIVIAENENALEEILNRRRTSR